MARSPRRRPVAYGDGQAERLRTAAPDGVDAFIDTFGNGYVELGLEPGVAPLRINTIIDFGAVERLGVHALGCDDVKTADLIADVVRLAAAGELEIPIARTFPLDAVRAAYAEPAERRTLGNIVLRP